jgi:hypothetical protein
MACASPNSKKIYTSDFEHHEAPMEYSLRSFDDGTQTFPAIGIGARTEGMSPTKVYPPHRIKYAKKWPLSNWGDIPISIKVRKFTPVPNENMGVISDRFSGINEDRVIKPFASDRGGQVNLERGRVIFERLKSNSKGPIILDCAEYQTFWGPSATILRTPDPDAYYEAAQIVQARYGETYGRNFSNAERWPWFDPGAVPWFYLIRESARRCGWHESWVDLYNHMPRDDSGVGTWRKLLRTHIIWGHWIVSAWKSKIAAFGSTFCRFGSGVMTRPELQGKGAFFFFFFFLEYAKPGRNLGYIID